MVATGDMLGQMAAEDYPERLAGLYLEFREATVFSRLQNAGFCRFTKIFSISWREPRNFTMGTLPGCSIRSGKAFTGSWTIGMATTVTSIEFAPILRASI